jgi:putative membrane protein
MPMPYWFNGGHMIWMTFWWLVGILFFVALVWVLVRAMSAGQTGQVDQSPETVLRRRYAAGDIDKEEFERRLATLRKTKDAA